MAKLKIDLVEVDVARFIDAIDSYFLWKELDSKIRTSSTRGVNFPESISEAVCCYAMDYRLNKGSSGDAVDTNHDNEVIEIKATSNWDKDITSFSPNEEFDNLLFVRLDKRNDVIYIYNLNMNHEELGKIKVNQNQTLKDQQLTKRRPRFSIIKQLIDEQDLKPIKKVLLRTKEIEDC